MRPLSTDGCDVGSLRQGLVCTTPFLTWWVDQGDVVPILQVSPLHQHHGYLLSPLVQLDTSQRVCYCALSITRTNGYDVSLITALRCRLYTIQLTDLKCTVKWIYLQSCVTPTTASFRTFSLLPQKTTHHWHSALLSSPIARKYNTKDDSRYICINKIHLKNNY